MLGSALLYSALVVFFAGLVFVVKPMPRFGVTRRTHGAAAAVSGALLVVIALTLPASESRVASARTRLDQFMPVWQFREVHHVSIAAAPHRVMAAIRAVRADDITFLRTLTWIRRGGDAPPELIDAARRESMIDLALHNGFISLADDPPRELVVGTVIIRPRDVRLPLTPQLFQQDLPPNFALATMNFLVTPDGGGGSIVSTETRVFANSDRARRRFAAYWRIIYPGSAIIRRMWLRAIEKRATLAP